MVGVMQAPTHVANWYGGWGLILGAFLVGAALGMGFHREEFLGGYTSFRRRIIRLGHIAMAALGLMNVVYAIAPWPIQGSWQEYIATHGLLLGGVTMPLVCFLSGWQERFRHLFFIPVTALVVAVVSILLAGAN